MKSPMRGKSVRPKPEPETPACFLAALGKDKRALAAYKAFSPAQRREYVTWLTEAKTEETRAKRLAASVEWISEGKIRNWKYVKK